MSDRAAEVWAALDADPEFAASMERARADFYAGRAAPYRHRYSRAGLPYYDIRPAGAEIAGTDRLVFSRDSERGND